MADKGKINALISLLDDPDQNIYNQVKNEILSIGEQVIPNLEESWETHSFSRDFQSRIENIIHEIQYTAVHSGLQHWIRHPHSLLEGIHLINKLQYPDIEINEIEDRLQQLSKKIWVELDNKMDPRERTAAFNYILFVKEGFRGNKKNYHNPQNSFISEVLNTKKGNPISLSILYILLAEKLNIPFKGVNLPNHFVVGYFDEEAMENSLPLFYINPFGRGMILTKNDLGDFVEKLNLEDNSKFYAMCSNKEIVKRTIVNLIYSYSKMGYHEKMEELKQLEKLFS